MLPSLIFDLDGLLVDSEPLYYKAYKLVLAKHDLQLTREEFSDHCTRAGGNIASYIALRNLPLDPVKLRHERIEVYSELISSELTAMPGALELIKLLHGRTPLALATSSLRQDADDVLTKFDIANCFDVISTKESVTRQKPNPDILLHTAKLLGVEPSDCVVFEDAEKGVIAASAAGMKVIAVPNDFTCNNDFSRADMVLTSLAEVTLDLLETL